MRGTSRTSRLPAVLAPLAIVLVSTMVSAGPAHAQSSSAPGSSEPAPGPEGGSAGNQVVLVGRVVVPRGQAVGEVVVFSGRVVIEGIARGDVVVVDGSITVSGQVSGSVVAIDGSVRLLGTAQVGGDVVAHDRVIVAPGAAVDGQMREGVSFNVSRPLRAVAAFVSWLAVAVSTLVLGLLFAFVAPRGLDRTAESARTRPWASAGWGIALAVGLPALAVLALASVLGIPLGIGLLLSTALLSLCGVVVTAQTVGRVIVDRERRTATAFLAGWAIETVVGVIPFVSGAVFAATAIFGLGATMVAVWRARGPRRDARPPGKHRAGASAPTGSGDAPGL
jgi:cytoskeletal protein CcmA (bactofilin family)